MLPTPCRSRLPSCRSALQLQLTAETSLEETALEFYEKCNESWRLQYTNPSLVGGSIGTEFMVLKYGKRHRCSQLSTNIDTDSENSQIGNSLIMPELFEYFPELSSDYENLESY